LRKLARSVNEHPMELLPGVAETLAYLGSRHSLILMSKGDPGEQSAKLDRSGLRHHFSAGNRPGERPGRLSRRPGAPQPGPYPPDDRQQPKSDVNPALAAGLNAARPHDMTWFWSMSTSAARGEPPPAIPERCRASHHFDPRALTPANAALPAVTAPRTSVTHQGQC
jgi:putative hydrolase of the HAD superfamily